MRKQDGVFLTEEAIKLLNGHFIADFIFGNEYLLCKSINPDSYFLNFIAYPNPTSKMAKRFKLKEHQFSIPYSYVLYIVHDPENKALGFGRD